MTLKNSNLSKIDGLQMRKVTQFYIVLYTNVQNILGHLPEHNNVFFAPVETTPLNFSVVKFTTTT